MTRLRLTEFTVEPGDSASIQLPVADLYTSTSLCMPVRVFCGRQSGPVLLVSAAVHGDELNGVEVVRRLLKRKILRSIKGTLVAVPVVNVHGFLDQSRYLPDRRDLNRCFPGTPKGSIASRMAHTFMDQLMSKADYGIDLHTGAINRSNLPQIRGDLDGRNDTRFSEGFWYTGHYQLKYSRRFTARLRERPWRSDVDLRGRRSVTV